MSIDQDPKETLLLHRELVSLYLESINSNEYLKTSIWQRVNQILHQLSTQNPKYQNYLMTSNNIAQSVDSITFRQKIRSAIDVMSTEYGLEELTDIIKRNRYDAGMNITNTSQSNPVQSVNQYVDLTIEKRVLTVIKEIEDNLSEEELVKVRSLIETYKIKPTRSATEKLLRGILDLGKEVAIGVIANIIIVQMGLQQPSTN